MYYELYLTANVQINDLENMYNIHKFLTLKSTE